MAAAAWISLAGFAIAETIHEFVKRARAENDAPAKRVDVLANYKDTFYITVFRDGRDFLYGTNNSFATVNYDTMDPGEFANAFTQVVFPRNPPRYIFKIACSTLKMIAMTDFGLFQANGSDSMYPCEELKAPVVDISAGRRHFMAWATDGFYTWGSNKYGQLNGHPALRPDSDRPTRVATVDPDSILCASCGCKSTVFCTADSIYGWGIVSGRVVTIKNAHGRRVQAVCCLQNYMSSGEYSLIGIVVNNTIELRWISSKGGDDIIVPYLNDGLEKIPCPGKIRQISVSGTSWSYTGESEFGSLDTIMLERWASEQRASCVSPLSFMSMDCNSIGREGLCKWNGQLAAPEKTTLMGRGTAHLESWRGARRLLAMAHAVGNEDCLVSGAYLPLDMLKLIAREGELV